MQTFKNRQQPRAALPVMSLDSANLLLVDFFAAAEDFTAKLGRKRARAEIEGGASCLEAALTASSSSWEGMMSMMEEDRSRQGQEEDEPVPAQRRMKTESSSEPAPVCAIQVAQEAASPLCCLSNLLIV